MTVEPKVFGDSRGYFLESYNQKKFEEIVGKTSFVQDNESKSYKGVLRGLHFQKPPYEQAKIIYVLTGEIFDVFVDIRPDSKTFGSFFSVKLTNTNGFLYIPKGFAHGFCTLSDNTIVNYKTSNFYSPDNESTICSSVFKISVLLLNIVLPLIYSQRTP